MLILCLGWEKFANAIGKCFICNKLLAVATNRNPQQLFSNTLATTNNTLKLWWQIFAHEFRTTHVFFRNVKIELLPKVCTESL